MGERNPDLVGRWATDGVRCPRCGCSTLVNNAGDRWCSFVGSVSGAPCAWGIDERIVWPEGAAAPVEVVETAEEVPRD